MITLLTGLPGNGKTLFGIENLRKISQREDRPVYYSGINDLKLPWFAHEPKDWEALPPKALLVVDEAWKHFPVRPNGSAVPPWIGKLAEHRHKGVDIWLIVQHPSLLDAFVRKLVGQHFHVHRKFGTQNATVHEWQSTKDNCDKQRTDSIKHHWSYPKDIYDLYKSADAHTYKRRIPAKVWLFVLLPVIIGALVWVAWTRYLDPARKAPPVTPALATGSPAPGSANAVGAAAAVLTPAAYVAQHAPRVEGLAYTAPVYDGVTEPVEAPFPAACVVMGEVCRCYSQQATRLDVPDSLCRSIVERGFFVAWQQKLEKPPAPLPAVVPSVGSAPVVLAAGFEHLRPKVTAVSEASAFVR